MKSLSRKFLVLFFAGSFCMHFASGEPGAGGENRDDTHAALEVYSDPFPSTCPNRLKRLGLRAALMAGGGILLLTGGFSLNRIVSKDRELDAISRALGSAPISAVASDSTGFARYAPVFWREKLKNDYLLDALAQLLVEDLKRYPELADKAKQLGISVSKPEDFYRFVGLSPEIVRPRVTDRIGGDVPYNIVDFGIRIGDIREANFKSGPLFGDSYERMDELVAKWLELQYESDRPHNPSVRFDELDRRFHIVEDERRAIQRAITLSDSSGGTLPLVKSIAKNDQGAGTLVRYRLPAEVLENGKLLDWVTSAQSNWRGGTKGYSGIGFSGTTPFTPTFADTVDRAALMDRLDVHIRGGKVSWVPVFNKVTTGPYREHLDNLFAEALNLRLKANPTWTTEQGIEAVIKEIE